MYGHAGDLSNKDVVSQRQTPPLQVDLEDLQQQSIK